MRADTAGRAGIDDPRRAIEITDEFMAVTIDYHSHVRKLVAENVVQTLFRPLFVTMQDNGLATWQVKDGLELQVMQYLVMFGMPLGARIIVAAHSDDLTTGGLHRIQDVFTHDIPGMYGNIARPQYLGYTGIEVAVGIGNDTDPGMILG